MPFQDTKDGQTHSYNDGCGVKEHNNMTHQQKLGINPSKSDWQKQIMV